MKKPHQDIVLETAASDKAKVKSLIAASWARSLKTHQLQPDDTSGPNRYESSDIEARRSALSRMISISQTMLDQLHSVLSHSGCSIFLCDADGVILSQRIRDADVKVFESAGLAKGADWSEKWQGTNGIGTCIAEQRPVTVYQDQHFRTINTGMTCSGAPIFGRHGELAAILDISTCNQNLDKGFVNLLAHSIRDTAGKIEANHFADSFSEARIVRGKADGVNGPVLFALNSDDLVIGATLSARKQYKLPLSGPLTPKPASDILGDILRNSTGLENAERRALRRAIARSNGNMSAAARGLGISRATLYRRATKLGLTGF